jgi:predicted metal-dependent hydrolase
MDGNKRGGSGDSPQFELAFPVGNAGERIGDSPLIRVSARARRLSIRVFPDARVEVVVPPRARPRDVEAFIATHREWIDSRRAIALRNRPAPQPFPPAAIEFRMTAERWQLHVAGGVGRLRLAEGEAKGSEPNESQRILRASGGASRASLRAGLRAWLLRAARLRLTPRVAALAAATGVRYSQVSVRRQRSRWGSCSARGTISLNCCLLFQRPEVVDYLIVHELMHVKHMNHSARFWQAVERHCTEWRVLDRELVQGWRHVPRWVFSEE